ncbi:MAG: SAM-dependent methyltransferase, partial [Planctomycetota bacterium]
MRRFSAIWLWVLLVAQFAPQFVCLAAPKGPAVASAEASGPPDDGSPPREKSVRPGINEKYLAADLEVDEWLARFEIESREVYAARGKILDALSIKPGMHVADVGAGTGYFSALFSKAVGPDGW